MKPILSIALLLFACTAIASGSGRFFTPTQGYIRARDLPPDYSAVIDTIIYRRWDALEGSKVNSPIEEKLYNLGNKLHIISKLRTIRRRLLFRQGGRVTRELLLETERRLRQEGFLADAIIEVADGGDSTAIIVHTYDQWSTVPGSGFKLSGGQPIFWFGPVESNLIGTGQKIELIYKHLIERDVYSLGYESRAFIFKNFHLSGTAEKNTDGYAYAYTLGIPLFSKSQKWGFDIRGYGNKSDKTIYQDADESGRVVTYRDKILGIPFKGQISSSIHKYPSVVNLGFTAGIVRSFGTYHKFYLQPRFKWNERYQESAATRPPAGYELDFRNDYLAGIKVSYEQKDYKIVSNFRNLKWSENLDVGLQYQQGIYQNMKVFGAHSSQLYMEHFLTYINVWNSRHFLSSSAESSYFLSHRGVPEDGLFQYGLEYQWKWKPTFSTIVSSQWTHLFAYEASTQLWLGGEEGFSGYGNRIYTGQARILTSLEQRWFPHFELGTFVPVLAAFIKAGDTYPSYDDFNLETLHYSAGIGLRMGATRTVQRVVTHLNLSFPIASGLPGSAYQLELQAKKDL